MTFHKEHPDDSAVDRFAAKMKTKMAASRAKGREGWDDPARCSSDVLKRLLFAHAEKGDPIDVANFCMMLDHYGASTSLGDSEPVAWLHVMQMEHGQFQQSLMFCERHPWGTPGVHYDASYGVKSHPLYATLDVPAAIPPVHGASENFPQPKRRDGQQPCGECHLPPDEVCDICGASWSETPALAAATPSQNTETGR